MGILMRHDPFTTLRRGDPFNSLREMQRDMDRLFDQFFGRDVAVPEEGFGQWTPLVESYLKGDNLVFRCELPGVDPKNVDVSFDENAHELKIKGERKQEKDTKEEEYLYREFSYGSFERRFTLPAGVKFDKVKATYANGILEVTVPAHAVSKPKKIEIETSKLIEGEAGKKAA